LFESEEIGIVGVWERSEAHGVPDEALFELLEMELQILNVAADDVITRLP